MMIKGLEIPQKSTFKLDEVCKISGVKPYILRFWESEFSEISPLVSASGQKIYEHKDIEVINKIKHLMFDKKLNLEKAKASLSGKLHIEEDSEGERCSRLDDRDLQKLVLAKAKLQSAISKIQTLKSRYNT